MVETLVALVLVGLTVACLPLWPWMRRFDLGYFPPIMVGLLLMAFCILVFARRTPWT